MKPKKAVGIGIAVVAVVVAIIIGIWAYSNFAPQYSQNIIPYVTVSGSASTTGAATKPVFIDFTSDTGASTSANVAGGSYSITLANQHSYTMTIHYSAGFGITSGTCNAGTLSVYSSSSSMQTNISC